MGDERIVSDNVHSTLQLDVPRCAFVDRSGFFKAVRDAGSSLTKEGLGECGGSSARFLIWDDVSGIPLSIGNFRLSAISRAKLT